jgi:hypothetical protein
VVSQDVAIDIVLSAEAILKVSIGTCLRLKVLEQNLQLYGLSPESDRMLGLIPGLETSATYAVAGVAADGPCVGISCRIDCRLTGFEPPF